MPWQCEPGVTSCFLAIHEDLTGMLNWGEQHGAELRLKLQLASNQGLAGSLQQIHKKAIEQHQPAE